MVMKNMELRCANEESSWIFLYVGFAESGEQDGYSLTQSEMKTSKLCDSFLIVKDLASIFSRIRHANVSFYETDFSAATKLLFS